MPEDVDAAFDITQQGEAFRQNMLGMASNLISGQADLDLTRAQTEDLTNKVPVTVGGKTFNLHPREAAKLEYDKYALAQAGAQAGFDNVIKLIDTKLDVTKDEREREKLELLKKETQNLMEYRRSATTLNEAKTRDWLARKTGTPAESLDLSDHKSMAVMETNIRHPLDSEGNPLEAPPPYLVQSWNSMSNTPYAYLWHNEKGITSGGARVKPVPLPMLPGYGQPTASDFMDYANSMGMSPEEAFLYLSQMTPKDPWSPQ